MMHETFDRTRLSPREDAILVAAIEGLTDVQIAQRLEITQSTVNSYWVRIRGKLGSLSRTELVALALKRDAQIAQGLADVEIQGLRDAAKSHARVSEDYAHVEIYRAALEALPEAALICCAKGLVRYANPRLEAMFGYGDGELVDQSVGVLVPRSAREHEGSRLLAYMAEPVPMRLGVREVLYGQRKNGTQFRVVLLLDGRLTSNGPIAVCVVRDFASEIETRREFTAASLDPVRDPR